jgi:hypothetical protein
MLSLLFHYFILSIATVSADGVVTGKALGSTTVRAFVAKPADGNGDGADDDDDDYRNGNGNGGNGGDDGLHDTCVVTVHFVSFVIRMPTRVLIAGSETHAHIEGINGEVGFANVSCHIVLSFVFLFLMFQ